MQIKLSKYCLLITLIFLVACTPIYGSTDSPSKVKQVHLLNRIAFGANSQQLEKLQKIGIDTYIQQQLHPDQISIPSSLQTKLARFSSLDLSPAELSQKYNPTGRNNKTPEQRKQARKRANLVLQEAVQARLLRAIDSPRQLEEVMVDFWFNHFNVFSKKGRTKIWVGSYENDAIRPHVLGKFRDLLEATARHPAMLLYLDNWRNTAPNSPRARGRFKGINENYARELMELHTLGVDGGYKQEDVEALARILTGWGFNRKGFYFDAKRHDFNDKVFLGTTIKGSGEPEVEQALDILTQNPATARHISYKLAQYFVSDTPPPALVKRLQNKFLETDGDIRAVLQSLLTSREFWNSKNYNVKFKTPYQYVISAIRATDIDVSNTLPLQGVLSQMGMPVYGCLTPDGYKSTETAWLNPEAMTRRLNFATALGRGRMKRLGRQPARITTLNKINKIPSSSQLMAAIGYEFSPKTLEVINSSPKNLRSALVLGSPEFMRR